MTKKGAYERLELSDASDLQVVRRKFAEMYNDYRMHIDNAHTHGTRIKAEQRLEELKEAYALLNGSDQMDDSVDLPRTAKTHGFEDSSDRADSGTGGRGHTDKVDQALALFGFKKENPSPDLASVCQKHITDLESQAASAELLRVKAAYESELIKARNAWNIIENWIEQTGVEQEPVSESSEEARPLEAKN